MNSLRRTLLAATCIAAFSAGAQAQNTVKIAGLYELSGAGATSGTMFKNGVEMAVKEINEAGGILGKKSEHSISDTQSNPGVAKGLATKAIDDNAFAVFGPVFSGSILVSMAETRKAETPNFTGGEAAAITKQGNPYVFRTSFTQDTAMPKVARYIAGNLLDAPPPDFDVIVAADVFYEQRPAQMFRAFLERCHASGITIFAGDPGRTYFPRDAFRQAAEYSVETTTEIENHPVQTARVWTL